jgi:putative SOS response-associated peptidase YedK
VDGAKGQTAAFLASSAEGRVFAGIWERWRDREGNEIDSVAIITCDANATVTPLHDRMPVVLGREDFEAWLDCKTTEVAAAQKLLKPAPDDLLEAVEMHPQINDSRREEPGIQQPLQTQLLL